MHIPDGYLSPATCAVAYAISLPFWFVAFRRVKRLLHTRMVPLLAVFSAFCFVIMMFNLPLPGGTTGHAVGVGIATVVLGPWASMVAISIALLIQAVFFGDGGITTFGANCLNMAVVGSLVAYWTYSLIAGRSDLRSYRRVIAAALAGYLAINVSALFAAVEFGIQPMLFHDATGAPLYAPYPLAIAVPAMMIGHLSLAGVAELAISGGLVAYLQRANPGLLAFNVPTSTTGTWKSTRALWYVLAGMMILTPLGLLAAGTAWGEWGAEDFSNAEARQAILHASGNVSPPDAAPLGMARLAGLWTAPIPDYAPGFMRSASSGYFLSAVMGVGLILLLFLLISKFMSGKEARRPHAG
jgi:cobalt/nickel transport system permease protein